MARLDDMSLPDAVEILSTEVLADLNDDETLSFAYATGPALAGFGEPDEVGLVCVWDRDDVPVDTTDLVKHITAAEFDGFVKAVTSGDGWQHPGDSPLSHVAEFADGILLADDTGAGTAARGITVSEFPRVLADRSAEALRIEAPETATALTGTTDRWTLAQLLLPALHRAYVAWFATADHYFAGPAYRRQYAERAHLDADVVCELEDRVWTGGNPTDVATRYTAFVEHVLAAS